MTARRRLSAALLIAAACTATALAGTTGTIEGRVTDTQGKPLAAAVVSLVSERVRLQAHTDARGHYHFLSVYPDEYTIVVDRSGHRTFLSQAFEVHADQTTTCNVRLGRALTGLYLTPRSGNRVVTCMY